MVKAKITSKNKAKVRNVQCCHLARKTVRRSTTPEEDYIMYPVVATVVKLLKRTLKRYNVKNVWILKRGSVRDVWMSVTNFMTSLCHPANVTFTGFVAVAKLLLLTLK